MILVIFDTNQSYESKHHKPQRFVVRNGLPFEEFEDDKSPKVSRATRLLGNNIFDINTAPVLTFKAYYRDPVGEGFKSTTRFRECNVLYFLDDDEMKIYEPPQLNSGLQQGCIVGKGKFIKPEGGFYTIDDLNINESIFVNAREFKLINCDPFTRKFLTEMGYRVPSPQPDVYDPITEDRKEMNKLLSYRKPVEKEFKGASFLKNHPRRLRFFGTFGDGKNLFEEERECILYYDLADGTIKIVEERHNNKWIGGRSDTPVLLRPTLVPKKYVPNLPMGELADPTLLNLAHDVQNVLISGKYYKVHNPESGLADSNPLEGRRRKIEYYKDTDIKLGERMDFFGFKVFLYDCDEFTKSYFHATHNIDIQPVPRKAQEAFHSHKIVLKHEDFGLPEESLRTNDPFKPKEYNVDLLNFFKNERYAYKVRQMKFIARILSDDPVEKLRRFVICFFLEDDTMSIKSLDEDFQNKNAMEHGNLTRMKVVKPHSTYWNSGRNFYHFTDMFVGNVIYIRGKGYELLEADEYTIDYMEKHSEMFPHSNVRKIMTEFKEWIPVKVGSLKFGFEKYDPEKTGYIKYEHFREVIYKEMPSDIKTEFPEHAMKTVGRYYAEEKYIGLCLPDLVSRIQSELYRKKFHDFDNVKLAFQIYDSEKVGYLDPDRIYYILRTTSLPINRDLMKGFIYKFPKNDDDKINYTDLVTAMNWVENPQKFYKVEPHAVQINWERLETEKNMDKIKYNCFLIDIVST